MKKPKTSKELYNLVNPKDLLYIFGFSGINSQRDAEHAKLSRKYEDRIFESIHERSWDRKRWIDRSKDPRRFSFEVDEFYDTLIKCLQDFYFWSHEFNHSRGNIGWRIVNALEIDVDEQIRWNINDLHLH